MDDDSIYSDPDSDGVEIINTFHLSDFAHSIEATISETSDIAEAFISSATARTSGPHTQQFVRRPDRPRRPARQATRTPRDFRASRDLMLVDNNSVPRPSSHYISHRTASPVRNRITQLTARFPEPTYAMRRTPRHDMYDQVATERVREVPAEPEVLQRNLPESLRDSSKGEAALLAIVKKHSTELERLRQDLLVFQNRQLARSAAKKSETTEVKGEECPICMEPLIAPGPVLSRCGHMFHMQCISQCLSAGKAECPMCRSSLYYGELVQVMTGIPQGNPNGDSGSAVETVNLVEEEKDDDEEDEQIEKRTKELLVLLQKTMEEWDFVAFVKELEDVRKSLKRRYKEEVNRLRVDFREQAALMLERKDEIEKTEQDLKHTKTRIDIKESEINDTLTALKKKQSDLNVKEKELELKKLEMAEKAAKLNDERDEVRREKDRLQLLLRQKMKDRASSDPILLKENERLRKEIERLKRIDENTSPIVVSSSEDDEVRKDAKRRREGMHPDISLLFGGNFQVPAKHNRPAPVRRGATGLGKFVQKRPKVQRPMGGIAGACRKVG